MIYEAAEDSFLLRDCIKDYAKVDFALDVGTGSGVQAVELAKYSKKVLAIDINPEVIKNFKKEFPEIEIRQSDLFSNVSEKFDLIVFNPPYLPSCSKDPNLALDGGPEGWELIARFLKDTKNHLTKSGVILLLFSSFSKKEKVINVFNEERYTYKEIAKTHIHFEDLFVYELKYD